MKSTCNLDPWVRDDDEEDSEAAERRAYWRELGARIIDYSGGQCWPTVRRTMNLEQRIGKALTGTVTSAELSALVADTEFAIEAAEKAANAERAKALDPLQSPDADAAHAAMRSAEFAVQRLRSVLPRLQQRYRAIEAQETYKAWATTFDPLVPKHGPPPRSCARSTPSSSPAHRGPDRGPRN